MSILNTIIKGIAGNTVTINGGFFPCKPEVFNLIYDKQEA